MKAYAVAQLTEVDMGPAIIEYIHRIDDTLAPFGGRFIVHGGAKTVLEGHWPGDLIVIEFPGAGQAKAWYDSSAYRQILDLRRDHSSGNVMLVEGVGADHRAPDILAG